MHEEWTLLKRLIWLRRAVGGAAAVLKTVTGALLHITDALAKPAHELVAVLSPKQEGSGDPSPDNVRPISGWTGANIYNVSGNVFNPSDVTITPNKIIGPTGTISDNNYHDITSEIEVSSGDVFIFSNSVNNNAPSVVLRVCCYNANMTFQTYREISAENTGAWSGEVTIPEDVKYIRLSIVKTNKQTPSPFLTMQMQKKQTLHITFTDPTTGDPMTVYGVTLTPNEDGSADMEIIHWYIDVIPSRTSLNANKGNMVWAQINLDSGYYSSPSSRDLYSNIFTNAGISTIYGAQASGTGSRILVALPPEYNTTALIQQFFTDNQTQFAYLLATPITYHFDNVGQLMLFAGENNIWVDASDGLTLTYYADGNVSDLEALNTLLGGAYVPGDVSDRDALNILLGN